MNNTLVKTLTLVAVAAAVLAVGGCKKEQKNTAVGEEVIITLQPNVVHIGAQWVDGALWVESYDPITRSCLLRQYDTSGKMVEGSNKVRLRGCRIELPANATAPAQPGQNKPAETKTH